MHGITLPGAAAATPFHARWALWRLVRREISRAGSLRQMMPGLPT